MVDSVMNKDIYYYQLMYSFLQLQLRVAITVDGSPYCLTLLTLLDVSLMTLLDVSLLTNLDIAA